MITTDISLCVETLAQGDLVAFPTETVFGLGARADSPEAVAKIFAAKGRPKDHPLISHCATAEMALSAGLDVPEYAHVLAEKFWPGPLTLILKNSGDQVCSATRGGHDTVAVRVPSHPRALELLKQCDFFVAAPSANKFGRVSPTTSEHVESEFKDVLILSGDQSEVGVESTIISCLDELPRVIRSGKITEREIEEATGLFLETETIEEIIAAPGTLESHYAPSIPVYVFENETFIALHNEIDPSRCAFLSLEEPNMIYSLVEMPTDVDDYAHSLYNFFRKAEEQNCQAVCVIAPPLDGIGAAINDRLARAAHSFAENAS